MDTGRRGRKQQNAGMSESTSYVSTQSLKRNVDSSIIVLRRPARGNELLLTRAIGPQMLKGLRRLGTIALARLEFLHDAEL